MALVDIRRHFVQVAGLDATLDPMRVHLGHQTHALVHRHGQRLCSTHSTQTRGDGETAPQGASELLPCGLG